MSTPSKKRRKAREWMQREYAQRKIERAEGTREGHRQGAADMAHDMMALLPNTDTDIDYLPLDPLDERKQKVTYIIKRFPDPYERGPYYQVPMPTQPLRPLFSRVPSQILDSMSVVNFRPIEHAISLHGERGISSLVWFTWEPDKGSDELKERTSALFTSMGKLTTARMFIRDHVQMQPSDLLLRALVLIDECVDEIRRRLGKFAPEPDMSRRERINRYFFAQRW